MTAADKIEAARALIKPLRGHTPAPWFRGNTNEVHDIRFGETPVLLAETHDPRCAENARLIAAAPALRDTVAALADLADAQAQENARLRYVLEGVRGAIDTGRNEPLMIWRDQINIALGDAP